MTPAKVCGAPGCPELRPCPTHQANQSDSRGWEWSTQTVPAVLTRDQHACQMCGRPCPHPQHHHVDHIRPRIEGGLGDLANLRTVCRSFNLRGVCEGRGG